MKVLPEVLKDYLCNLWLKNGQFAYLIFDAQGIISYCETALEHYGLSDLHCGDEAVEKLIFLAGLIPYQEPEVFLLPAVNFANGIAADIHILPTPTETYVLFFDVTEIVQQRQRIQQERHNIDLLYQQQNKNIDILKQTYQELELKKKQAETANKAKTKLLSHITHDLRTPLTSILGFAQFLDANLFGELNEEQRDCVTTMLSAGHHMNELIGEILTAAHLESGNVELQLEPLNASWVIAECMAWLQPIAEKQQITLINHALSPVKILADSKRFKQIIINVVNNAIKYNQEHGCIVLSYKVVNDNLRIIIKDTGIGIAEDQMEKMFQPFARVLDKEKAKKIEGNGVGLNESKQLVELMQGSLSVRSELNIGSVFYIDLPLAEDSKSTRAPQFSHRLVYFYQDVLYFELFSNLLTSYKNHQIFGSDSSEHAVQLCTEQAATVLLIEINTQALNASIAQIQWLQSQIKQTMIIAIFEKHTAAALITQILTQTHTEDYLLQPFDFNQVLDILERQ